MKTLAVSSKRLTGIAALAALALVVPTAAQASQPIRHPRIVVDAVASNVAGRTFAPGATVTTTGGRISNRGFVAAQPDYISWYVTKSVGGAKKYLNGLLATPALGSGEVFHFGMDLVLPSAPGKYFLGACWDQDNSYPVAHSKGTCASLSKPFTIG
jgi:opacity protein-like surface antigen